MKISKEIKNQILADKDKLSINEISKKYNLPRIEVKKIITDAGKKAPKWFYVVPVLLPVIFLILLEVILRITNYGYNFNQWKSIGEGKQVLNSNIGRKYFPSGAFVPTTSEDEFDIHKKPDAFRVFVLGESSAEGFPFSPMGSFARYIRKRLELVYPKTTIEVINLGMTAINSYTLLDLLPGVLKQKPDLILIYTGHNEYYGALGVGSVESFGSSRTLIRLILYLDRFKTTQLVRNTIHWVMSLFSSKNKAEAGTIMSRIVKDKYILLNSKVYNEGIQQFKENMTDILKMIKGKGVPVILGSLVSNLRDQKPFISVPTPGYQTADQVYDEAESALKDKKFTIADSLFLLAKDLDALRFRAPEKINTVIDNLGKEFNAPVVPIDSIFDSASPDGIVGDNLIVDHLHPNLKGYELMGQAFYNCMEKNGDLPKKEKAKIPFSEQDSLTRANFMFTKLDSIIGNDGITILKDNWPYKKSKEMSKFQQKDFDNLLQPKDFIDSLAMFKIEDKVSWADAHLIGATYYLRRDDIKEYLKYMNVLIYQYPGLKDLDGALRYFYEKNELNLADYTPKRDGLMALYIGNFDNAIKYLTEANKSDPKDSSVLYNLSLAYSKKKDFKTALELVNKCLIIDPKYPEANDLKRKILNQVKASTK